MLKLNGNQIIRDHFKIMTEITKILNIRYSDLKEIISLGDGGYQIINHGKYQHIPSSYASPFRGTNKKDPDAKTEIICHVGTDYPRISENINNYIQQYREIYPDNKIFILNNKPDITIQGNINSLSELDDALADSLIVITEIEELGSGNNIILQNRLISSRKVRNTLVLQKSTSKFAKTTCRSIADEARVYCFYNISDMQKLGKRYGKECRIKKEYLDEIKPVYIYLNLSRQDNNPVIYGDRLLIFKKSQAEL